MAVHVMTPYYDHSFANILENLAMNKQQPDLPSDETQENWASKSPKLWLSSLWAIHAPIRTQNSPLSFGPELQQCQATV